MYHGRWQIPLGVNIFWIFFFLAIIAIAVIFFLVDRAKRKVTGLSENQEETLEDIEIHIMAMLSQHGGNMNQVEISNNLSLPVEIVSNKLLEMEKKGMVVREWLISEFTYHVNKAS